MSVSVLRSLPSPEEIAKEKARRGTIKIDFEEPPDYFKDHAGQLETWNAVEHVVAVFAGWQSGKSVTGPPWLIREIQRMGFGDYAVLAPTAPLLRKKALPELLRFLRSRFKENEDFEFKRGDMEIHFHEPGKLKLFGKDGPETKIFLGHAMDPRAVEAFTAKAIWVDEPGQIPDESWESIEARLGVEDGRVLLTSRPYDYNWYITKVWDRRDTDPRIKVINYSSIMNPAFKKENYYRQKELLPSWKFRMKYDGIPTRPAGAIYDCFEPLFEDADGHPLPPKFEKFLNDDGDEERITLVGKNACKRFDIPSYWRKSSGHDFGPRNTAAVFAAQDPKTSKIYIYRAYHAGGKTTAGHIEAFRARWMSDQLPNAWGGAPSEKKTRIDFSKHGWVIQEPPIADVREGIMRVYSLLKSGLLVIFDDLKDLIQDLLVYSWKLNDDGEPLVDDANNIDKKSEYHRLDALRYLCSAIYEGVTGLLKTVNRFEDPEEEVTYESEEEPYNPYGHLGWKLTGHGWVQTGEPAYD